MRQSRVQLHKPKGPAVNDTEQHGAMQANLALIQCRASGDVFIPLNDSNGHHF